MKGDVQLGDEARDKITGFRGIVVSISKWLTGCDRYALQPPIDKDGKVPDIWWVDEPMLELVKVGEHRLKAPVKTGGPQRDPVRR